MSEDLRFPGLKPLIWREPRSLWAAVAWVAAVAWPPLVATLLLFPPQRLAVALGSDWRLVAMVVALGGVPLALAFLDKERRRDGLKLTRLGILWRMVLFGAVGGVIGELLLTLIMVVGRFFTVSDFMRALSGAETAVMLYGVAFLPFVMIVGVAYGAWAGLATALIAFTPRPEKVKPRLGLLDD